MIHKKQAYQIISDICKLNNDVWDNKPYTYNAQLAAALVIEEALEKLPLADDLSSVLSCANTPKEVARAIVSRTVGDNIDWTINEDIPEVGAFDSSLDAIYIEIGNMHTQGLSPEQIIEGLQVVHDKNLQKSGTKDAQGKVSKPTDFTSPEPLLQLILDKRSK